MSQRILSGIFTLACLIGTVQATYVWKHVCEGGGGYVTGIAIQADMAEANPIVYIRTDVGGAYRYDFTSSTWTQLVTETSLPSSVKTTTKLGYSVDGIAVDPSNANVVYIAIGNTPASTSNGALLKSTDRGATWNELSCGATFDGNNGEGRLKGERIAVDPVNSNIVYVGSRTNGLWRSTDGGTTWGQVSGVPAGTDESKGGVAQILLDSSSGGASGGKTNRIYAMTGDAGIYQSIDGGSTWSQIVIAGKGYHHMEAAGGNMWVNYHTEAGSDGTNGIAKYNGTSWVTIASPPDNDMHGFFVRPDKPNVAYVFRELIQSIYRTTNGGTSWTAQDEIHTRTDWNGQLYFTPKTWAQAGNYGVVFERVEIDPRNPSRVWVASGDGVNWSLNFSDDNNTPTFSHHTNWSQGIEELCSDDVIATTNGRVLFGVFDFGGFSVTNLDSAPTWSKRSGMTEGIDFTACLGFNYSPQNRNLIVVGMGMTYNGSNQESGYSTDGGATWHKFASQYNYGQLAIAANNINNLVWAPINSSTVYYSSNTGGSWSASSIDAAYSPNYSQWNRLKCLVTDGSNGNIYLYSMGNGNFFSSTNNGASFHKVGSLEGSIWTGQFKTVPGFANEIWCASGQQHDGLFHSSNGGASWSKNSSFTYADAVGMGKPLATGGYPTLYVAGISGGTYGIYRSTDQGVTWTKISGYACGIMTDITCIDGDWDEFGKVYAGIDGQGFAYGEDVVTALRSPQTPCVETAKHPAYSSIALAAGYSKNRHNIRKAFDCRGREVKSDFKGLIICWQ